MAKREAGKKKTEAPSFGPQQIGDKFNCTSRIERGYLFCGDGEDCVRRTSNHGSSL